MINGTTYLVPCESSGCLDCTGDYTTCLKCNTSMDLASTGKCESRAAELELSNQPTLSRKTYRFTLEFTGAIENIDYLSRLNYKCYTEGKRQLMDGRCEFTLEQLSETIVTGSFNTEIDISPIDSIRLEHRSMDVPAFYNLATKYPPSKIIEVISLKNQDILPSVSTVKSSLSSVWVLGTVFSSIVGLSTNELPLLKVIHTLEYLLFLNGMHMYRADSFIRTVNADVLKLFPNLMVSPEDKLDCISPNHFAKEDVSCSLLNNYGSQLMTLILMFVVVGLVFAANFGVTRLKKANKHPRLARGFEIVMKVPSMLLSRDMLLKLFEGSQIKILRLSFLNIYTINKSPGMIWGAAISIILVAMYLALCIAIIRYIASIKRKLSDMTQGGPYSST